MKFIDVSYHGSHYNLSCEEYLEKSKSNIKYASYLKDIYSILFIFHSGSNKRIKEKGITFDFRKKRFNSKMLLPIKLSWIIKNNNPDIILVHSILYIHFAAFLRLFVPKKTIILIQNHGESPTMSYVKKKLIQYCDKFIDGYLFTSKKMGQSWIDNNLITDSTKIFEVMEGSSSFSQKDKKKCKMHLKVSPTKPVFLWVGRLDQNKDPLCVLEAFKKYRDIGNDFELYMFYHTVELLDTMQEFIRHNGLQQHIFLKGKVEHKKLEDWYNASDFYVSASHKEGSGYALCEAMACGCIPIVSLIPSFEYMTAGVAGLLFEKGNSNSLLENLIKTRKLNKEEYRNKVTQVFQERLSFNAIAIGIDNIIQTKLAKK